MKAQERGENETREWEGGLLKGIYPAATSDFDFLSISHFSLETLFLELSPLPSSLFLFMESRVIQMDPTATSKSPPSPPPSFPCSRFKPACSPGFPPRIHTHGEEEACEVEIKIALETEQKIKGQTENVCRCSLKRIFSGGVVYTRVVFPP